MRKINFITALLAIGLAGAAKAQPDAPQPQPTAKCGPSWLGGCWDYSHPTLSTRQTFRSRWFLVPVGLADSAYWADALASRQAIERGCIETNADLPERPTMGDYAANWAKLELPLDALEWAIVKLNRRPANYIVAAMSTTRIAIHMHGVHAALACR